MTSRGREEGSLPEDGEQKAERRLGAAAANLGRSDVVSAHQAVWIVEVVVGWRVAEAEQSGGFMRCYCQPH